VVLTLIAIAMVIPASVVVAFTTPIWIHSSIPASGIWMLCACKLIFDQALVSISPCLGIASNLLLALLCDLLRGIVAPLRVSRDLQLPLVVAGSAVTVQLVLLCHAL
jgi:hypothetical protein